MSYQFEICCKLEKINVIKIYCVNKWIRVVGVFFIFVKWLGGGEQGGVDGFLYYRLLSGIGVMGKKVWEVIEQGIENQGF